LVGTDSLILIDEAHLAMPFVRTVTDASAIDHTELAFGRPIVVTMTATPTDRNEAFCIDDEDIRNAVAGPRLRAPKTAHLVSCPKDHDSAPILAAFARHLVETTEARVAGIVVNTVARARETFDALVREVGGGH